MTSTPGKLSLFKRSNRFYYIVYDQNGRRRWKSTGATTRSEALKALSDFKTLIEPAHRTVSYPQFQAEFMTYAEVHNAKRTVDLFRNVLKGFHRVVKDSVITDITAVNIDRYKTMRLQEVKPVSVNIELRMLKSAFGTAMRWKMIDENPCKGVPFAQLPDQSPIFLAPKDFEKLIHTIPEIWFRELVVFAVLTGLRRAEIVNLRWVDVDMVRGVINIQSSPRFKTKQGKRRTIPLNSTDHKLLRTKRDRQAGEYVFTLDGGRISGDWVSHLFKRYVRKAKLADERVHFHSARHSFASWLVQGGATLYEVQKLLGHSSSKVTEIYSHLQPEQMHATVNRIVVSLN
jgi:site-specific recombinase XerD